MTAWNLPDDWIIKKKIEEERRKREQPREQPYAPPPLPPGQAPEAPAEPPDPGYEMPDPGRPAERPPAPPPQEEGTDKPHRGVTEIPLVPDDEDDGAIDISKIPPATPDDQQE